MKGKDHSSVSQNHLTKRPPLWAFNDFQKKRGSHSAVAECHLRHGVSQNHIVQPLHSIGMLPGFLQSHVMPETPTDFFVSLFFAYLIVYLKVTYLFV